MVEQQDERSRESSRRILQIAEREVGRIILDIHDGPVQNIFAALSQLYMVQRRLGRTNGHAETEESERIRRSISLLEHSLNEIRTFMGAFRPPEFERRDLIAVLEGLVIQHEELTGNPVTLDVRGLLPTVSLPVKISLYRILQEALSNSTRHGHADHHAVLLYAEGNAIVMEVADEGDGFDVGRVLSTQEGVHIGLEGMRERVGVLGGSFDISSKPGLGTTVRVVVPWQ
ncbi:MAG: ATP-binding protein [Chloroflexaceae bacterium]|nr:ATP-binding protein [Chloroflexaceae bacterium]